MKKFLAILFASLAALSLFACGSKQPEHGSESDTDAPNNQVRVRMAYDTLIQDANGEHKCLWEDGKVFFDEHSGRERQIKKSASLSLQTEYDMWFFYSNKEMELSNTEFYYPTEFEYDETKIEITESDKDNHFILRVIQPCNKEEIAITLKHTITVPNENGKPISAPSPTTISITITAEA